MVAEIVSIGTELLLGQIVDTNAAYLARTLSGLGINVYRKTVVGDNQARVEAALREALGRADLVLTSGGLGPTQDDLTRESVAAVCEEELVLDQPSLAHLEGFFQRRGVPMPDRNRKQALRCASGSSIPNPNGTAPGLLLEKAGRVIISLPGPPRELVPMVEDSVVPYLSGRLGGDRMVLRSRVLRFVGIGESALEERVEDLLGSTNPTVAPLAHLGEVHLRLTAQAPDVSDAEKLISPVEREIRERVGEFLYGADEQTLEDAVIQALVKRQMTLAVAESCTGGLLGARLTNVPGSSATFHGGIISYSNDAKQDLLRVPLELLNSRGAVSEEIAQAMAHGARLALESDLGVSITGVAGPDGGSDGKPVGLVFVGICDREGARASRFDFSGNRNDIRFRATQAALDLVRRTVAA